MTEGCVHVHIENGVIKNIFCHLSNLPENGVIHLKPEYNLTNQEFQESHPYDSNELLVSGEGVIYNLADKSI